MKKLGILFLSALSLAITVSSCSKDETSAPAEAKIEGKWSFTTIQALDSADKPTGDAQAFAGINGGVDATCATVKFDVMTFNAAGAAVYTDYPSTGCTPTDVPFTYTRNAKALSLDFGGDSPLTAEIMSLTSTDLKLKIYNQGAYYQLTLKRN